MSFTDVRNNSLIERLSFKFITLLIFLYITPAFADISKDVNVVTFIERSVNGYMGDEDQTRKAELMLASGQVSYSQAQEAYEQMGYMFEFGKYNQKVDLKQAEYWYKKCAVANSSCQAGLGFVIKKQDSSDTQNILFWLKKAANNGNARSQTALGAYYFAGDMVDKNYNSSYYWLSKAAGQNDPAAFKVLKLMADKDDVPEYIRRQALNLIKQANKEGKSQGSGMLVSPDHILTSNYIAESFKVVLIKMGSFSGKYNINIVAQDRINDMALIYVNFKYPVEASSEDAAAINQKIADLFPDYDSTKSNLQAQQENVKPKDLDMAYKLYEQYNKFLPAATGKSLEPVSSDNNDLIFIQNQISDMGFDVNLSDMEGFLGKYNFLPEDLTDKQGNSITDLESLLAKGRVEVIGLY